MKKLDTFNKILEEINQLKTKQNNIYKKYANTSCINLFEKADFLEEKRLDNKISNLILKLDNPKFYELIVFALFNKKYKQNWDMIYEIFLDIIEDYYDNDNQPDLNLIKKLTDKIIDNQENLYSFLQKDYFIAKNYPKLYPILKKISIKYKNDVEIKLLLKIIYLRYKKKDWKKVVNYSVEYSSIRGAILDNDKERIKFTKKLFLTSFSKKEYAKLLKFSVKYEQNTTMKDILQTSLNKIE